MILKLCFLLPSRSDELCFKFENVPIPSAAFHQICDKAIFGRYITFQRAVVNEIMEFSELEIWTIARP